MGNAAVRGPPVEERLTQPRRLVRQLSDLDSDRLRRLIRSGDLAPCFDAADEDGRAVECPICFHFYPSLNRSRCCGKGICTECFLQLMPSKASRAVHCPFCKTAAYAVEYRGARTLSEKKLQRENRTFMRVRREYIPRAPVDISYYHRSRKPDFAVLKAPKPNC